MTVLYSSGAFRLDGPEPAGCWHVLMLAMVRAHPHMPRRRKSISPHRASTGSASPRAAMRSVSYCVTTVDSSAGSLFGLVIAEFFFQQRPARSSWDVCVDRISLE